MQRLYRWIGAWDAPGIAAREQNTTELRGASVPTGQVEWLEPPKHLAGAADTESAGDIDADRRKKHPSALVRPAWPVDSKLIFSMAEIAWMTVAESQAWLDSAEGQRWRLGAVSYTLLALDS
jgi:hypothetical protein